MTSRGGSVPWSRGDEVILHQVPVLLGNGRRFFQELPTHIGLSLVEAVPAPGVTHLRYRIEK